MYHIKIEHKSKTHYFPSSSTMFVREQWAANHDIIGVISGSVSIFINNTRDPELYGAIDCWIEAGCPRPENSNVLDIDGWRVKPEDPYVIKGTAWTITEVADMVNRDMTWSEINEETGLTTDEIREAIRRYVEIQDSY